MDFGLEICIDSLHSAENAISGGADQLEVCSALALGGLTPSIGLVRAIRASYPDIPLMCMIRARGGDFIYSEMETTVMLEDVKALRAAGATGFVFGFLDGNSNLDVELCRLFRDASKGLPCTLHRAFDLTESWKKTVDLAVELGFCTILTSGQEPTAMEATSRLAEIRKYARQRIKILVGSGVSSRNLPELIEKTGCRWFHGSASKVVESKAPPPRFPMGTSDSNLMKVTCEKETKKMKTFLNEKFCNTVSHAL